MNTYGQYNMRRAFMGHVMYELKLINLAARCKLVWAAAVIKGIYTIILGT